GTAYGRSSAAVIQSLGERGGSCLHFHRGSSLGRQGSKRSARIRERSGTIESACRLDIPETEQRMKKSVPRSILVVLFLAAALAPTGCIRKAKPASPAGFIPPENLSQPTDLPFNAAWRKKDLDWHHYTEIYIAPWNTEYL